MTSEQKGEGQTIDLADKSGEGVMKSQNLMDVIYGSP